MQKCSIFKGNSQKIFSKIRVLHNGQPKGLTDWTKGSTFIERFIDFDFCPVYNKEFGYIYYYFEVELC
jgi:hypothetical protein